MKKYNFSVKVTQCVSCSRMRKVLVTKRLQASIMWRFGKALIRAYVFYSSNICIRDVPNLTPNDVWPAFNSASHSSEKAAFGVSCSSFLVLSDRYRKLIYVPSAQREGFAMYWMRCAQVWRQKAKLWDRNPFPSVSANQPAFWTMAESFNDAPFPPRLRCNIFIILGLKYQQCS